MAFIPRDTSGGVVLNPDGKILLVYQNRNSWSFPKGAIEQGESLLDAARREVMEETGLTDTELLEDLGYYERYQIGPDGSGEDKSHPPTKKHLFLFRTKALEATPDEKEVSKAPFVTIDEALALLTHAKDREFLREKRAIIEQYV